MMKRKAIHSKTNKADQKSVQSELLKILQRQFGRSKVTAGKVKVRSGLQLIDFEVRASTRRLLIKVANEGTALESIRSSLAQLLEYAYFAVTPISNYPRELLIIASAPITPAVNHYIDLLNGKFRLHVYYLQFNIGDTPERLARFGSFS
jgi:hypothetical protein